ncbi:EamA family transporter RarD [Poseidonibacter lekithochrous]|uniref:EamA family transporter RarD n=1 Tax=Poseidonibacter TaxID=2321187 RepID=UPI001C092C0B|nr:MULTISPECIES: EamA family transporter RarD [Poseidonibacter]MBU3013297.1 EamA family transporter RarD [Poseidonibacter lekithochrous]MDO6826594.1 EamA family transporter RarD [Poseidonibacter sp. 1_MG-2023]
MNENRLGQIYAVLAFLFWGAIAPIYFKQVSSVEPLEVLIHRIFWSFIILIPLLFITKQVDVFKIIIKDIKMIKYLTLTTFFISLNWLVFIWAVANDKIMETALGYYINPLVSVFLGYVFFAERMTRYQNFAIFIAFLAVLYQLISLGSLPIVSLTLALSFAFYGMIRKKINVGSIVGLFVETLILMPFALIGIYYLMINDKISFLNSSDYINIMLTLGGLITIIPLLLFNGAATRMKLSTLGFFQYLGPTCSFLLAIFIYNEEFNTDKLITFSLIWIALLIFSLDSFNTRKKNKNQKLI